MTITDLVILKINSGGILRRGHRRQACDVAPMVKDDDGMALWIMVNPSVSLNIL